MTDVSNQQQEKPLVTTRWLYRDQLNDPRWIALRNRICADYGGVCSACGKDDERMDVHHRYYVDGRMAWDYPDSAFRPLCRACHGLYPATDGFRAWESVMLEFESRGGDPIALLFLLDAAMNLYAPLVQFKKEAA